MPRIHPPGGDVDWPHDEGTLGVVGVAPWATLEFCRVLYARVAATKDWHYPRVLLDINTKLPSRGRHLQLGEVDPSPYIAATIAELAEAGASLVVVVCNTAHILYEHWARNAPIPVLHIIEETARVAASGGASRVAPLVSSALAQRDLYGRCIADFGLESVGLDFDEQSLVDEAIGEVKIAGRIADSTTARVGFVLNNLKARGVDSIIAGCTELSTLESTCHRVGLRFIDSNSTLAEAALKRLALPPDLLAVLKPR